MDEKEVVTPMGDGSLRSSKETHPKSETITMVFPRAVRLHLSPGNFVQFHEGPQEVPVELKNHWYLKAHGVTLYAERPTAPKPEPVKTPDNAAFDLMGMTKTQLEVFAASREIELPPNLKKDDMVATIQKGLVKQAKVKPDGQD